MIDEVFGTGGLLAGKFEGYSPRKGQVDMARAVEAAIASKKHLVVEGPTGTGKSLAYLVPAIDHAVRSSKGREPARVIVVTANIALQEQLVQKDLPLLKEVLGIDFKFALSKGKNNYLCHDALGKTLAEGVLDSHDPLFERLMAWAQSTETGDVSEFPETPPPAMWRKLSTSSDECKGSGCKHYVDCFAERAKAAAAHAHVVVTNYHMFFAHLQVRAKMKEIRDRGGAVDLDVVLPPAQVIVFDEAHKAADIARDFLGFQLSEGQVEWLVRGFNHDLAGEASKAASRFFADALAHKRSKAYKSRLKKGHPLDGEPLARVLEQVGKFYKDAIGASAWDEDEKAELELRAKKGLLLAQQVRVATSPEKSPDTVFFVEETGEEGSRRGVRAVLKSKPIEVAEWMRRELFESFGTVVLTSATLAVSDVGGFSFLKKEMGLDACDELVAESPFSWRDQVLLVVPTTTADPKNYQAYPDSVGEHVERLIGHSKGRLLALFTSFRVLEAAARACARVPYRIFKQGEMPRTRLAARFKEDTSSCLFGCESFWAGVDCPGETCSVVSIDRLPFPTPDDPIVDAIAEKDRDWFFNYAVPRGIIQFKQGFGRLIRTTSDRGCVVVFDRRIVDMGYGRSFLKALPKGIPMSRDMADVARFLAPASEKVA